MSLGIIVVIMLFTGIAGGIVNYLLPSNENPSNREKIRKWSHCVALGIGATVLVPLFLEIAQSKLLDHIHTNFSLLSPGCDCVEKLDSASTVKIISKKVIQDTLTKKDSVKPIKKDSVKRDSTAKLKNNQQKQESTKKGSQNSIASASSNCGNCSVPLKNYFLYAAYCFLAASAGFRFINSITDSVLKDKQIANLKDQNTKTTEEKEKAEAAKEKTEEEKNQIEKEKEKLDAHNKIRQQQEESAIVENQKTLASVMSDRPLPVIGPITNGNDPQKGRFGGKAISNNRALRAKVTRSRIPEFYNVTIWVESIDPANDPLKTDVIFYLHDSLSPSVYTIKVSEFVEGKALDDEILAYGAFTVGAVVDNGTTLLELDLAEQNEFPQKFRER